MARKAPAVICCRCLPTQKAIITEKIKTITGSIMYMSIDSELVLEMEGMMWGWSSWPRLDWASWGSRATMLRWLQMCRWSSLSTRSKYCCGMGGMPTSAQLLSPNSWSIVGWSSRSCRWHFLSSSTMLPYPSTTACSCWAMLHSILLCLCFRLSSMKTCQGIKHWCTLISTFPSAKVGSSIPKPFWSGYGWAFTKA